MAASRNFRVVVRNVDMPEEQEQEAIEIAAQAMEKCSIEREIAAHIKREMERRYMPGSWHCVVGRSFGSFITHDTRNFIYFSINHISILLFKYGE